MIVSVREDEKVLEMDGDDGCTMRMHLMTLNCTCKMIKVVDLMLSIFYHNKEKY